jgi:hypothetical protein
MAALVFFCAAHNASPTLSYGAIPLGRFMAYVKMTG